jgi:hypothetical protein
MRGTTVKNIRRWARLAWDNTPEEEKKKLTDYETFLYNVMKKCKKNIEAKKFILHSLRVHYHNVSVQ